MKHLTAALTAALTATALLVGAPAAATAAPKAPVKTTAKKVVAKKTVTKKVVAKKTTKADFANCAKSLSKATGWKVTCVTTKPGQKAYDLSEAKRSARVDIATWTLSPKTTTATLTRGTRAVDRAAAAARAARVAETKKAATACRQAITAALPAGWTVTCAEGATPIMLLDRGIVTVNLDHYRAKPNMTTAEAVEMVGGMPLPVASTAATSACQREADAYLATHRHQAAKPWTIRCITGNEIPITDALKVKGWQTWGLAYMDRPGGLILINADIPAVDRAAVLGHEWGHALSDEFSPEYRDALAAAWGIPFHGGTYPRNVTEVIAQAYTECTGNYARPEDYPLGLQCHELAKVLTDGGVQGHGVSTQFRMSLLPRTWLSAPTTTRR